MTLTLYSSLEKTDLQKFFSLVCVLIGFLTVNGDLELLHDCWIILFQVSYHSPLSVVYKKVLIWDNNLKLTRNFHIRTRI